MKIQNKIFIFFIFWGVRGGGGRVGGGGGRVRGSGRM